MGLISEFKEFAMGGSLVDMATGIVIGGAFGGVITSFVNDVLMPPIGMLLGGQDFSDLKYKVGEKVLADGTIEAVTMNYGAFINHVISFIIVAFAIFMVIKGINKARKQKEEEPAAPPANEVLLAEIRDLLKK